MKYTTIKKELVLLFFILAPVVYLAWVWNALPEKVPMHFGANGHVNGWGSKTSEFILPVISLVTYFILLFIPLIDPKRMNYEYFQSDFYKIRVLIFFFLGAINILVINAGLEGGFHFGERFIPASVFLFLAVLGNFTINIKPNWFVGIRTPWTLSSDYVWRKTHQVGGRLLFYGGL